MNNIELRDYAVKGDVAVLHIYYYVFNSYKYVMAMYKYNKWYYLGGKNNGNPVLSPIESYAIIPANAKGVLLYHKPVMNELHYLLTEVKEFYLLYMGANIDAYFEYTYCRNLKIAIDYANVSMKLVKGSFYKVHGYGNNFINCRM